MRSCFVGSLASSPPARRLGGRGECVCVDLARGRLCRGAVGWSARYPSFALCMPRRASRAHVGWRVRDPSFALACAAAATRWPTVGRCVSQARRSCAGGCSTYGSGPPRVSRGTTRPSDALRVALRGGCSCELYFPCVVWRAAGTSMMQPGTRLHNPDSKEHRCRGASIQNLHGSGQVPRL